MSRQISIALAFLMGAVVNFLLHRFVTFNESKRINLAIVAKYLAVLGLNLLISEVVIGLGTDALGWTLLWSKIVSLPLVFVVGYVLSKRWVFSQSD